MYPAYQNGKWTKCPAGVMYPDTKQGYDTAKKELLREYGAALFTVTKDSGPFPWNPGMAIYKPVLNR